MSARSGFALGFACAFRGVARLAATPKWWGLALAPALVTAVGVAAAFTPAAGGLKDWIDSTVSVPPDGWLRTVYDWFFGTFVVATAVLFLVFVYAPLVRTVAAPFLALLADLAVAEVSGQPTPPAPGSRVVRWAVRPLAEALLILVVRVAWMAVTSPLLCVPVVGPLLWALVLMPLEGFDVVDLAVGARGKVLHERVAWAHRHRGATLGLGCAKTLILLVPCLNLVLLPGTVVGAVLLDQRLSDDFPGGRRDAA